MRSLLMMVALMPVVLAVLARQMGWSRVARRESVPVAGAPAAHELAVLLATEQGREVTATKGIMPAADGVRLVLPRQRWEGRDAASLGLAVQAAGWVLWARREPEAAAARLRVLRFGAVVPGLAVVVAVFAVVAAKLATGWALTGVLIVTGLAAALQLSTLGAEMRAAAAGLMALRASRLAIRGADRERVEACTKAAAWRQALPLSLAWTTADSGSSGDGEEAAPRLPGS